MSYWRKCLSTGEYQYIATGEPAPEDIVVPWWEVELARKEQRIVTLKEELDGMLSVNDNANMCIVDLKLRLGCCRDASTGKDLLIAELEKRITELGEALRALACEYEYQVCADEHYDKAMAVVNSTGKDS